MTFQKQVKYYELNNGKSPFLQWKQSLDKKLRTKVDNKIFRLQLSNTSDCSILKGTDGVIEARIKTHSGIRLYYGEDGNDIILLLMGGDKDTQQKDIEKAKLYWNDHKKGGK